MNFSPSKYKDGSLSECRWVSDCGGYVVSRYKYKQDRSPKGYSAVEPYYRGYTRSNGKRITGDCPTLEDCIKKIVDSVK